MPRAIFTSTPREKLILADVFLAARHLKATKAEDQFEIGSCQITCRYEIKPGDFVSKQVLGCWNAIRTGGLRCKQKKLAVDQVLRTVAVLGIAGPDDEVEKLAMTLAKQVTGIIVTAEEAIVADVRS